MARLAMATFALACAASPALAQLGVRYDRDGDGKVTRDEFRAARVTQIMQLDRDKDGRVTRAESRAVTGLARAIGGKAAIARLEEVWTLGDTDRDGVVTREEAARLVEARFPLYDRNRDGWLGAGEMEAVRRGAPDAEP